MKILTLAAAATLGFATTSFAGGTTVPAPDPVISMPAPIATGTDWGGFYAGATYGVGVGGGMDFGPQLVYDSLEPGSSYGAFAGYNVQRNNLVFGGEIAYSLVDPLGFGAIGFPTSGFNYFLDVKARAGFAMNNVLVYGFAGYTLSEFVNSPGVIWDIGGLNYGVGIDLMLGSRVFVGAEYIARNLTTSETNVFGQVQTANIQVLQLRAGMKF